MVLRDVLGSYLEPVQHRKYLHNFSGALLRALLLYGQKGCMTTRKASKRAPEPVSEANPITEVTRQVGRPRALKEDWSKISVDLFERQVIFLDRLATDIREQTGAVIKRTGIIRALIDACAESGIDLTNSASEAEIKEALISIGGKKN